MICPENYSISFENICAGRIQATIWHEGFVIPAKAGIHPLPPLDAGLRRHDGSMKQPVGVVPCISYSVDERKLMNTRGEYSFTLKPEEPGY